MNPETIKLLLVEDNPGDARLVRENLHQANTQGADNAFDVSQAERLSQALEMLAQQEFDAVLLDLSLPDSHRLDSLHQTLAAAPELPVVVLSGLDDKQVAFEAVKAGAQDYLVKGYVNEFTLPRAILYAIERKQTEKEMRRRNQELALFNKIVAASTTSPDPEEILDVACLELAKTFVLSRVTATLFNQDKTIATVAAQFVAEGQQAGLGAQLEVGANPLLKQMLYHKGPLVIEDAQNDPRLASFQEMLRQYEIVSMLVLPLGIDDQVIGSLTLEASAPRSFSPAEIDLAWSVADQVAGVLARSRLDQERQLLSTAIENAADCVMITDAQGFILYINSVFEQLTGYSREELIGQTPAVFKSGKHDDEFYKQFWATISAGEVWHGQFINQKKNGEVYTADTTVTPVGDASGQIANYVAVSHDITAELERQERSRQSQKMEAVGRLAGGVAHDFNNLLTVINGYAELLLYRQAKEDSALTKDLEQIVNASKRAAALTGQLLAFSRKQVLQPTVVDLNDIILDISKLLRRLIGENIDLVIEPAEGLGRIKVDPGQMEQIIMNLAVNARDAMPQGGKLTLETANVYLDEAYARSHADVEPGWYVRLTISDTGLGMDAETQAKIFEPFFTTKSKDEGTGLGLATVYGIVQQSNGYIWVYSEPGQGTTFKIYFPQLDQPVSSLKQNDQAFISEPGTETVLVVEDEEMVRELVCYTLSHKGYTVLSACNGPEALDCFQNYEEPIDMLLTDIIMPGGVSGSQLGAQLVSLQPDLKVLYMSGYTDNDILHRGILEEGVFFIQKPFSPPQLAQKVRQALDS